MKTKKVNWKKRYYILRAKYKKLQSENNDLGFYKNDWMYITSAITQR